MLCGELFGINTVKSANDGKLGVIILGKIREGEDVMTLIRRHPLEGGGYLNKAALVAAYEQLIAAGSMEALSAAGDSVFATVEAIDSYKAQAVTSMAATVDALQTQLTRAEPYLARSRGGQPGTGS